MIKLISLIGAVIYLSFVQTINIEQKVNVDYNNVQLKQVLNHLQQTYEVKFSYVDNIVPLEQKVTLEANDIPLKSVLAHICQKTRMEYQLIGDQIVLKPEKQNKAKGAPAKGSPEAGKSSTYSSPGKASNEGLVSIIPNEIPGRKSPDIGHAATMPNGQTTIQKVAETTVQEEDDRFPQNIFNKVSETVNEITNPDKKPKAEAKGRQLANRDNKIQDEPAQDYEVRPYNIGFIHPISSNGMEAGNIVNRFSLHLLAGYSAGLDGVEFSGIANIEKDFVHGAQFAGFSNMVGNYVDGAQFAGFGNLVGGNITGAQFAGFGNVVSGNSTAIQAAGFSNINLGYTEGAQISGFANIVADSARAGQFAGFVNIVAGNSRGLQAAGFMNVTGNMKGSQLAGFANIAGGDITGVQISGFMNVARNVTGSQISFLNVADSVSGVPVGFLSLVRKGYHHVEIWGAETMHTNIALKLGVDKFYNIFHAGARLDPDYTSWALGYGIGSQISVSRHFKLNLDLISSHIFDERNPIDQWEYLNLLNQFRLLFNYQIKKHFSLYAGPTYNVWINDTDLNPENDPIYDISPYSFYDKTFDRGINVKMWIGFNAGIRF